MLGLIFPREIDNTYRGRWLAIWLLVPILFVKLAMSANTLANTYFVITGPDQIPLQTYSDEAQQIIVFMFKAWGLGLFLISALGLLVLIRYRAMVPLMYLVLALENVGRKAFALADPLPIARSSSDLSIGTLINLALIAALVIGFLLSIARRPGAE